MPPTDVPIENLPNFIDRLPTEIADTVCSHLGSTDIASLRLTSRFWTNIATPWLLSEAHLIFKPDSFERLLAISRHPVISRHVTSLFYEPDMLQKYYTQEEWEDNIPGADWTDKRPASPMPGASEREHRAYRRDCKKLMHQPRHPHLKDAYAAYKKLYEEQKSLGLEGYGAQALADALSGFPNLIDVYTLGRPRQHGFRSWSVSGALDSLRSTAGWHSASAAKLSDGDWKFFKARQSDMEETKQSMRSVRDLELVVSTGHTEDELGIEIPECREYLENNSLCEFLKASPDLEVLSVSFDWFEPYCPAHLKQVVGNSTWPRLRSVSFEYLDTDMEDLIAFFERHCSSLYTLNLITIRLLRGRWAEVLERMHATLSLKSAYFGGKLLGEDPYQSWIVEPSFLVEDDDLSDQGNRTRKAIQDYLVAGGSYHLRDEEAHPQS